MSKKKGQKLSLSSFLADTASAGKKWGDETDDLPPPAEDSYGGDRGGDRYGGDRGGDRYGGDRGGDRYGGDRGGDRYGGDRGGDRYGGDRGGDRYGGDRGGRREYGDRGGDRYGGERGGYEREERPQKEAPQEPPFIAFLGNLSFDATEDEVGDFFAEHCKVMNVRLQTDRDSGKPKGFGYIEFEDRESLVEALSANNVEFCGRRLKVDVAESRQRDGAGKRNDGPSRADQVDRWERGKGVPPSNVREDPRDRRRYDDGPRRGPDRRDGGGGGRPRLNLKPRGSAPSTDAGAGAEEARKKKSNPFGDAKPRDELAFQRKKEEERKQREAAAAKKKAEADAAAPAAAEADASPEAAAADGEVMVTKKKARAPPKVDDAKKNFSQENAFAALEGGK